MGLDQQSYMHALQDMAAKWRQDVQHDRQLVPEGVAGRDQRLQVDTAGKVKFWRGNGSALGPTKGPQCGGTQEGTCTCMHVHLHLRPSTHMSIHMSTQMSTHMPAHMSTYYLRPKTEFAGALHVSAIWDLLYQNC